MEEASCGKRFIALFALAAVGLIQPTVTSARGGDGGGQWAIRHETLNLFDAHDSGQSP